MQLRPPPLLLVAAAVLAAFALAAAPAGEARAQSAPPPATAPDGQLAAPEGVVMLRNGTIYVADTGNDRIQVFHNDTFVRVIGSPGSGPGELSAPTGIHVHREGGMIYVADTGNDRIQVFHPNGTPARVIGSPGSGPGELMAPEDVHVQLAAHPFIAVADTGNDRVQFYYPNGTFALAFGENGTGPGQFDGPTSVYFVLPLNGVLFAVADTGNDRVQLLFWDPYGPDRRPAARFFAFSPDGDSIKFSGPRSYAEGYLNDHRAVVADTGNHSIQVFVVVGSADSLGVIGSFGAGPGNFSSPKGVDVNVDGEIAVADTGNDRVQVFHANRTLKFIIGSSGGGQAGGNGTGPPAPPPGTGPGNGTAPPPAPSETCGAALTSAELAFGRVAWGGRSDVGSQVVRGVGTLPLTAVSVSAGAWIGTGGVEAAPANATSVRAGTGGAWTPLGGVPVAVPPSASGRSAAVEFRVDLPQGGAQPGAGEFSLSQAVTYAVSCGPIPDGSDILRPLTNGVAGELTIVAVPPPAPPPVVVPPPAPPPAPVTVVIEPGAVAAAPLNFTAAGHAVNLTIDVAELAGADGPPLDGSASSTVTFPPSETSVVASFATVTFPPGVTAAHVPAGGRLALHVAADVPDDARVQGALAYEGSGRVTLQRVVEVGGASGRVTFDMPVRILLEGQAGGRAFYIEGGADGGTITPIDQACAADDAARVHRHLGGAGECQMDSADGDKIIYTYHLTRFGTALPAGAAPPPPVVHTCSASLGMPSLVMADVQPGGLSDPVRQTVINSGSAPFARVDLSATMWRAGPSQGANVPAPLPASATEISTAAADGPYTALVNGTAVAHGLESGGGESPLWFMLNLTSHADARSGTLVQEVTYQATCDVP